MHCTAFSFVFTFCTLLCVIWIEIACCQSFRSSNSHQETKNGTRGAGHEKIRQVRTNTPLGTLIGIREGNANAYMGIPYAEPPIGINRFRPPLPKKAWKPEIHHATAFSPECLQSALYSKTSRHNAEDCLYLNIWQPVNHPRNKKEGGLPVMFWVYGGAFLHGGASKAEYIGDRLASRGIIVVSCNYRLGALGFLVSTVDGLYGNYGLSDQKMAMLWVQDNIRAFGGDPNRVTLFGESAGAMSIGLHIFDQHQRHQRQLNMGQERTWLFHGVILQSNPFGYKYRTVAVANFLGSEFKDRLDCEDLRCLQSESADELIHVQDTLMAVPRNLGDFFTWGPVITDHLFWREFKLRPGPFANMTVRQPIDAIQEIIGLDSLSDHVVEDLPDLIFGNEYLMSLDQGSNNNDHDEKIGQQQKQQHQERQQQISVKAPFDLPLLMGTTKNEGNVFMFTAYPQRMPKWVYKMVMFGFFRFAAPRVMKQYESLAMQQQKMPYPDYRLVLSVVLGDYLFRCPNQLFAALASASNTSVFLFEFALATKTPGYPCCDGLACHTSELPYVFEQLEIISSSYSFDSFGNNLMEYASSMSFPKSDDVMESSDFTETKSSSFMMDSNISNTDFNGGTAGGGGSIASDGSQDSGNGGFFSNLFSMFASDGDRSNMNPKMLARSVIDTNVSRVMANYWTTFAEFGDPNGHPSQNAYTEGTRPKDAPLWPKLYGDFSRADDMNSRAFRERRDAYQYNTDHYDTVDAAYDAIDADDIDDTDDDYSSDAYFGNKKNRKRREARKKRREEERKKRKLRQEQRRERDQKYGEDYKRQKINYNGDFAFDDEDDIFEDFFSKEKEAEDLVRRLKDTPKIYRKYMNYLQNRREEDENMERYMNQRRTAEFKKKMENEMKKRRVLTHQITFDEITEVYLIGNDCNCNFWNSLGYRF